MRYRSLLGPMAGIVLPYAAYLLLRSHASIDGHFAMPRGHFYIVSAVACLALVIAIAVGVAGSRLRNIKVSFLALSFVSIAELFMVHGLSTPNFILHATNLPGIAAQMSVLLASFWLWLSAFSTDHRLVRVLSKHQSRLIPAWTAALAVMGVTGMLFPHTAAFIPLNVHPLNGAMVALTIALNGIVMYRYYQSYLYSRFPLQIAIVYSSGWLIVAQLIMVTGEIWRASWWLYHFLLLASMIVMVAGLIRQYASNRSLADAIRALYTSDPIERITGSISPSVKALMAATEQKDPYTAGHNFRVTMYALKLAEELQLRPDELRALAQGTIVHDVGKINIPDAILNKPGRLTPEERSVIELHPVSGYEMCRTLGFMQEELGIIRWHHEKWDGTGYPDRLRGEQIPLMARIVAVADVYDALTSNRAYRQAMSHREAMRFLKDWRGTHFDPGCVDAWVRLCERDASVYQYPSQVVTEEKTVPVL
ncbi:HD-GYP domain-containing protein [Paenibacillus validus]|uniref:HD-GYP domain-containing protein n=1 Tax=Paenibacillus validus TaxID=44253 RepID=UPI003D2D7095